MAVVEHSGPSGRRSEGARKSGRDKVREQAKCWVMKDLASHEKDTESILRVRGNTRVL